MRYSVYYFAGTKSAHVDKARVLVGKIAHGDDGFGLLPFELLRRVRLKTQYGHFCFGFSHSPPYAPLRLREKNAARKQYQSILLISLSIDTTV